jgi:hypothetical protein
LALSMGRSRCADHREAAVLAGKPALGADEMVEAVLAHRVLDSLGPIEKLNVVCSAQVPRRDARIDPTLAWRASDRDWTVGGFPVAATGVDSSRDGDEL